MAMLYLSTILLSAFITVSLIPAMTRLAGRLQIVDLPDERKVHTHPVPRIGGLATAIGASVPAILWTEADGFVRAYLFGAGVLVAFGMVDDMKGLGYKVKFTGQAVAAASAVFYGGVRIDSLGTLLPGAAHLPGWFAAALSFVAIIGVTNAINLSDGLDGLAGGISLLGFCCIGYLAYLVGNNAVVIMSMALAGAIFGFLRYNTHPANLFMGDAGSQLLGFSAVVLAVRITQGDTPLSPVLPLLILGMPVLDTLTVMVERIRNGRSPFSADKNHFHHRLIRLGLTHAETVFAIYVTQAAMIVTSILFRYYTDWVLLASYAAFSAVIVTAFALADRTGFRFKRNRLLDDVIKSRLRSIRSNNWTVKVSFSASRMIIPLFFFLACLVPAKVPAYASGIAAGFCLLTLAVIRFAAGQMGFWLRVVLYLTAPLVLYLIEEGRAVWVGARAFALYQYSFGIIAFFVLLTVKYTRRAKGFRITPMDFLIVFIAVVVPNLPDQSIQSFHMGLLAVQVIVLLFSYEVLIKELRGKFDVLTAGTTAALMLVGIRGGAGF